MKASDPFLAVGRVVETKWRWDSQHWRAWRVVKKVGWHKKHRTTLWDIRCLRTGFEAQTVEWQLLVPRVVEVTRRKLRRRLRYGKAA